jgi:hypothetical protein
MAIIKITQSFLDNTELGGCFASPLLVWIRHSLGGLTYLQWLSSLLGGPNSWSGSIDTIFNLLTDPTIE